MKVRVMSGNDRAGLTRVREPSPWTWGGCISYQFWDLLISHPASIPSRIFFSTKFYLPSFHVFILFNSIIMEKEINEHNEEGHQTTADDLQKSVTVDTIHNDEAMKVLAAYSGDQEWTPKEEKKLLRKIDRRLLSILCVTYGLQYYDKAMLSQAVSFPFPSPTKLLADQALLYRPFLVYARTSILK